MTSSEAQKRAKRRYYEKLKQDEERYEKLKTQWKKARKIYYYKAKERAEMEQQKLPAVGGQESAESGKCWTCDKREATHKEWRFALEEFEWTCDECHRKEYPEQYEEEANLPGNGVSSSTEQHICLTDIQQHLLREQMLSSIYTKN